MKRIFGALVTGLVGLGVLTARPALGQVVNGGGGGATGTSLTVSTLTTGSVLDVTPTVSADGRYVTLRTNLSFSSLDGIDTFVIPLPNNNNGVNNNVNVGGAPAMGLGQGVVQLGLPGAGLGIPLVNHGAFNSNNSYGAAASVGPRATAGRVPSPMARSTSLAQSGGQHKAPEADVPESGVAFLEKDKALLAGKVPALTGDAVSLSAAVKQLAALSKQNLVLGSAGFKSAGVDVTAPLKLDIPAGTLKASLETLLKTAAPDQTLVVTAEDNVVMIATRGQADRAVVTKTYYEEDLLANAPIWLKRAAGNKAGDKLQKLGEKSSSGSVMALIVSTVRPEIWKVNGGKIGEIGEVNDRVTITAPESVHAILEGPSHYNPNAAPTYVNYESH